MESGASKSHATRYFGTNADAPRFDGPLLNPGVISARQHRKTRDAGAPAPWSFRDSRQPGAHAVATSEASSPPCHAQQKVLGHRRAWERIDFLDHFHEFRQGTRSHLLHDTTAVQFYGHDTDSELAGNLFIEEAARNEMQHLPLP